MDQVTQSLLGEPFFSIALGLEVTVGGETSCAWRWRGERRGAVMPSTLWLELCVERLEEEPGREGGLGQAAGKGDTRREGANVLPSWEKAMPRGPFSSR